jgi:hypothetical protein
VDTPFHPKFEPDTPASLRIDTIRLVRPDPEGRMRLGTIVAESFDFEIVVLACLPTEYRNQNFLNELAFSSRTALRDAAMALVFGTEWRATVASLAVESRIGDRNLVKKILGTAPA